MLNDGRGCGIDSKYCAGADHPDQSSGGGDIPSAELIEVGCISGNLHAVDHGQCVGVESNQLARLSQPQQVAGERAASRVLVDSGRDVRSGQIDPGHDVRCLPADVGPGEQGCIGVEQSRRTIRNLDLTDYPEERIVRRCGGARSERRAGSDGAMSASVVW